jgi:hypothetical protein
MRIFLAFAFCLSAWAQENPAEFKLPENFLRLDTSKLKLRPLLSTTAKPQTIFVPAPNQESCGHIRVLPVNPDMDPGIHLPWRTYVHSRMPILKGMPACETPQR